MQRGSEILYKTKVEMHKIFRLIYSGSQESTESFSKFDIRKKRKLIYFYHPIPNQEGSLAEKLN